MTLEKKVNGLFVMTDGIDGSGNGVIIKGLEEFALSKKLKVFDLVKYQKEKNTLPFYDELKEFDVILSAEPSYTFVGKAIREELIRKGTNYGFYETAQAYSIDREILYTRLFIPALNDNKIIFQQRGVVSSLVYQPVQAKKQGINVEKNFILRRIIKMNGNNLVLKKYSPHLLLITNCTAEAAAERLGKREKKDNACFEELDFQKQLEKEYASADLKKLFEHHGTKVFYIDTNPPLTEQDTKKKAVDIVQENYSWV